MQKLSLVVGLFFVMSILVFSVAEAQVVTTTALVGTVTDTTGAAIPTSQIVATNEQTHEVYKAMTNADGYYNIEFVKAGTYSITASQLGMQTLTKTGVLVPTDQIVRADFVLTVGKTTQRVTVLSQAPPMQTDEASLRETINTQQTDDLPLNGRDVLKLSTLAPTVLPGTKDSTTAEGAEDFNAAGAREIQNDITLDGVSIMNNIVNEVTFKPSLDTIASVDIQTGTYQAQYGNYMGLHMNLVTKSGTNQFHGAIYEFARNDDLDARAFFESPTTPKAPFRQNQFGFELGGPIVIPKVYDGRDKTFFMINYEGLREIQYGPAIGTVLTPRMRSGDFSEYSQPIHNPLAPGDPPFSGNIIPNSLLAPASLKLLQYEPLPNQPGIANNLNINVLNPSVSGNQSIDRVDQSFGEKTRFFLRVAWFNSPFAVNNLVPSEDVTEPNSDHNYAFGWVQVISPTMVNELHLGHQLNVTGTHTPFETPALAGATTALGIPGFTSSLTTTPGLPGITITGYNAPGSGTPTFVGERAAQLSDLLSWMHGAHSMSMGMDSERLSTEERANNTPLGAFTFSGTITGFAPADFMYGLPLNDTTGGAAILATVAEYRNGVFFVDKWQTTRKLTLSLGLRYELPTVPESTTGWARVLNSTLTALIPATVPQKIPFRDPVRYDFAPRFGFAYRATDKWVVRGGYGIYYNPIQTNAFTLMSNNPPINTFITYTSMPSAPDLSFSQPVPSGAVGTAPAPNVQTVNPHLPTAYAQQWSMDVERALWRNAAVDVQYLGAHTEHLDRNYYPNTPLEPGPGSVLSRCNYCNFDTIRMFQDDMISNYDAMNIVLRQNAFRGLTMLLGYTWSHDLGVTSDADGSYSSPVNPYNWRMDYSNEIFDLRHRFVGGFVYALPFLKHSTSVPLRYLLGNWQANGIFDAQTGFPMNVTVPGDPANTGRSLERPNIVGKISADCGNGHLINCIAASAFAPPAQYTYGNAGRDILEGPGLVNLDFSLFKNIPIGERANLEIRGEFFNVLNHPSFYAGYGQGTEVLGTPTFGSITQTSDINRQIQLALKLTF